MSSKMILSMAAMVTAPIMVSATTFGYYRSVFCDAQSSEFLIEGYASPIAMSSDKMCHQTPTGTMAMKIDGGIEENCVILAYDDYACTSLVGSVPASGKCVAATKARIGSWQVLCNVTSTDAPASTSESTSYAPGELKRRGKARLPKNVAREMSNSTTKDDTKTASSIVSEISSGIAASTSTSAAITTAPSAGAGLSSAIGSGTAVASTYNLTSYVSEATPLPSMTTTVAPGCTTGTNGTHGNATYTSPKVTTTATYTGIKGGNGTVVLAHGGAASIRAEGLSMVVGSLAFVMGVMLLL